MRPRTIPAASFLSAAMLCVALIGCQAETEKTIEDGGCGGGCEPPGTYAEEIGSVLISLPDSVKSMKCDDVGVDIDDPKQCSKNTGIIFCAVGWNGDKYDNVGLMPKVDEVACQIDDDCVLSPCEGEYNGETINFSCVDLCPIPVNRNNANFCLRQLYEDHFSGLEKLCKVPVKDPCLYDHSSGSADCFADATQCPTASISCHEIPELDSATPGRPSPPVAVCTNGACAFK